MHYINIMRLDTIAISTQLFKTVERELQHSKLVAEQSTAVCEHWGETAGRYHLVFLIVNANI